MSCCYCGKRVSLVRKRVDADFCCDEHREKYHARTRRSIETLREADEHSAVTRRLNEGIPVRGHMAHPGRELPGLMMKSPGEALPFGSLVVGLPNARPHLNTCVPFAGLAPHAGLSRDAGRPAPREESVRWNIGSVHEGPRPPRPFSIAVRLPQGGPKRIRIEQAACDRPRRLRTGPSVELGAAARTIACRINRHRAASNSIGALMRTVRPPAPVKPPPPTPPIIATLRHPTMAIQTGKPRRFHRVPVRMPEPGMTGISFAPPRAEQRPATAAHVPIVGRGLILPAIQIRSGVMPRGGEPRGAQRSVPSPEGFRRRQYYASEPLERFCGLRFDALAAHRPEIRIIAQPPAAEHLVVARAWAAPMQDPATAAPEMRRPAPPFREQLCLPVAAAARGGCELRLAERGHVNVQTLDLRSYSPSAHAWTGFAGGTLARHPGGLSGIAPAQWSGGTAEAIGIAAWAKPQNRAARRTASDSRIGVRQPVFAGPAFVAGCRQAGPSPEKPMAPPVLAPAQARARSTSVVTARPVLLPASSRLPGGLRQMPILASASQPPVSRPPAAAIVHPAYPILLPPALPAGQVSAAAVSGVDVQPPARQAGSVFDIPKGAPQMVARLALERFCRRGYEGMRSRHTKPHWPARSAPQLLALAAQSPQAHPAHEPDREPAVAHYRSGEPPAAARFRRVATLMQWGTLAPPIPGSADWGRVPQMTAVALPLPFVLPIDALGPVRDWGLAPPPEPEKPPEPIHEDFAAGLADWVCANADWKQDIAGVRTGSLALLRPSLNMRDYELEFLGKIENQSIGWVFRAANTSNYYAARIVLDRAAGTAQLVRFAVVAGEREQPAAAQLQTPIAHNATCRVKMSVSGSEFKLCINDKPAFEWDDDRLPEGGVGFFSDGDDRARLYWVKVTPSYEALSDELYQPIAALHSDIHREIRMGV